MLNMKAQLADAKLKLSQKNVQKLKGNKGN